MRLEWEWPAHWLYSACFGACLQAALAPATRTCTHHSLLSGPPCSPGRLCQLGHGDWRGRRGALLLVSALPRCTVQARGCQSLLTCVRPGGQTGAGFGRPSPSPLPPPSSSCLHPFLPPPSGASSRLCTCWPAPCWAEACTPWPATSSRVRLAGGRRGRRSLSWLGLKLLCLHGDGLPPRPRQAVAACRKAQQIQVAHHSSRTPVPPARLN